MAKYKKSLFGMDVLGGEISIEGWSDGSLWNGWDRPLFEFKQAQKLLDTLIQVYNQAGELFRGWYDNNKDSFYFVLPEASESEIYSAQVIEVEDGRVLKVYPIGTGAWIWEELSNSS